MDNQLRKLDTQKSTILYMIQMDICKMTDRMEDVQRIGPTFTHTVRLASGLMIIGQIQIRMESWIKLLSENVNRKQMIGGIMERQTENR